MAVMDSAGGTADDTIRRTLKLVFGLVPIVAGLDKFTDLLVQWNKYLAPPIAHLLPMTPRFFMHLVGIIEIVAGVGVLLTPWTRLFAWIVALWLLGIAVNLVVVVVNAGHMRVDPGLELVGPPELYRYGVWGQYMVAGPHTRLNWLSDWIQLPGPLGRVFPQAYSPGDLVSCAGLALVLFRLTRPREVRRRGGITIP